LVEGWQELKKVSEDKQIAIYGYRLSNFFVGKRYFFRDEILFYFKFFGYTEMFASCCRSTSSGFLYRVFSIPLLGYIKK